MLQPKRCYGRRFDTYLHAKLRTAHGRVTASQKGSIAPRQIGKIRSLKKDDKEPLWPVDIHYDFLTAVFDSLLCSENGIVLCIGSNMRVAGPGVDRGVERLS